MSDSEPDINKQRRDIVEKNQHLPEGSKGKLIATLEYYRDSFRNEIPNENITSATKDIDGKSYKVRDAWFNGLAGRLDLGIMDGNINQDSLIKQIEAFTDKVYSPNFKVIDIEAKKQLITEGDRLIDILIAILEAEIQRESNK